jgi:hypothetical protein
MPILTRFIDLIGASPSSRSMDLSIGLIVLFDAVSLMRINCSVLLSQATLEPPLQGSIH